MLGITPKVLIVHRAADLVQRPAHADRRHQAAAQTLFQKYSTSSKEHAALPVKLPFSATCGDLSATDDYMQRIDFGAQ